MIDQKIEKAEVKGEAARPPLPPFTKESATQKVRLAEDAWNTRDPKRSRLLTRLIRVGEIGLSFRTAAKRSSSF